MKENGGTMENKRKKNHLFWKEKTIFNEMEKEIESLMHTYVNSRFVKIEKVGVLVTILLKFCRSGRECFYTHNKSDFT